MCATASQLPSDRYVQYVSRIVGSNHRSDFLVYSDRQWYGNTIYEAGSKSSYVLLTLLLGFWTRASCICATQLPSDRYVSRIVRTNHTSHFLVFL
jgi:hypothetical protein